MRREILRKMWYIGFTIVLITIPAWASGDADITENEQVARLESLLEQQTARLESLEHQLVVSGSQDQDTARVEAMKQQIREVLSEQEFRESLMPSMIQTGYDGGFFIKSSDDNFKLKVNGQFQFRWTHYQAQRTNHYGQPKLHRNDRTGFDIQRMRIVFSGHAYTPDLTYLVEMNMDSSNGYNAGLEYAWVNYHFRDEFQVRAGLFKIASTRAQMASTKSLQLIDRPMVDGVFGLDCGIGVSLWGRLFEKRLDWYFDVVNSFNGDTNVTITPDQNTPTGTSMDCNPGLVFHAVWHALGEQPGKDLKDPSDLKKLEYPALDLGFHYAFNEDEGDTDTMTLPYPQPRRLLGQGGFGNTNSNGMQINQFGFESAFKYMGFSATGEYYLRILDPRHADSRPYTSWWQMTGQGDTVTMHGAYLQMGYMLPIPGLEDKLEAVGRVGGVSLLGNGQEGSWEYSVGLNYFLQGNKVKLQTDFTKVYETPIRSGSRSLANVNDDALIWRVQLQVAF